MPPRQAPSNSAPLDLVFVTTEDWYFLSHRLGLAQAEQRRGQRLALAARIEQGGAARLAKADIEAIALPWRRGGFSLLRDLLAVARLYHLYRRRRPRLVHHVALKPILLGTLAARMAGTHPIVNAVAGLGFMFTAKTWRARFLRFLFVILARPLMRGAQCHFLFQNPSDRAVLSKLLRLNPEQTHLIAGVGIDLAHYPALPAPENPGIIVALVARMLAIKGIDLAVAAIQRLRQEGLAIHLDLFGALDPGNPSAFTKAQIDIWQAQGGVTWHGHVEDIATVWGRADIAILPSRGGEGLPKALLEAAACARPMVGSDVPGIASLVIDGVTGIRVAVENVEGLAIALRRLADDRALRLAMGLRARAHIAAQFSAEQIQEALGALHQRLMSGQ